jgi:hypothetical protein
VDTWDGIVVMQQCVLSVRNYGINPSSVDRRRLSLKQSLLELRSTHIGLLRLIEFFLALRELQSAPIIHYLAQISETARYGEPPTGDSFWLFKG